MFVTSVHTPNGSGDQLISTSVTRHKIGWGGAIQAGYQYCFCRNFFIDIGYTYMQSANCRFSNSIDTAIFNGFITPSGTTLFLNRSLKFSVQSLVFAMNLEF